MRKNKINDFTRPFLLLNIAICFFLFNQCGTKNSTEKTDRELAQELIDQIGGSIIESNTYKGLDETENILAIVPREFSVEDLDKSISKFVNKYSDVSDEYSAKGFENVGEYRRSFLRRQKYFVVSFFSDKNENMLAVFWGVPLEPIKGEIASISEREKKVIERLTDIRTAQIEFRRQFNKYTDDYNQLVHFILYDSISRGTSWISVRDSLFPSLSYPIDSLPFIPYSQGVKFDIYTSFIERGLAKLPIIEVTAHPEYYLIGIDSDEKENHPPLKFGSKFEATTDGNWE